MRNIIVLLSAFFTLCTAGCENKSELNSYDRGIQQVIRIPHIECTHSDFIIKYVMEFADLQETNRWVHLSFIWKKQIYNLFYNKHTQRTYLLSPDKKHERDDDMRFWYAQTTYKDQLVFGVDPIWFLNEQNRFSLKYQEKYHLNDEMLRNVNENSNFIIAFYTLK